MRRSAITVLTLMVIVWSCAAAVQAQAKGAEQKPTTAATAKDTDQPDEVELAIAEARKHGDMVVGTCIEKCKEDENVIAGLNKGHVLSLPKPPYPPLARAAHASGAVEVRVLIDFDGQVIAAAAVSGHPLLWGAAAKAAREAKFTPTKLNGQPVKVTGVIQYNFVAQ